MKNHFLIFAILLGIFASSCKEEPVSPPEVESSFMLAIITPPDQVPFEFEADAVIGDYNPNSGLLRIEAIHTVNGKDKFEFTIKNAGAAPGGTYAIGDFSKSETNAKAQFIDGQSEWSARSISGTLNITQFEETETKDVYHLSGKFSFMGNAENGTVEISSGEIQRATIIQ